jgi:hypothetical protein
MAGDKSGGPSSPERRRARRIRTAAVVFTCFLIAAGLGYVLFTRFERGEPSAVPAVTAPPTRTEPPPEKGAEPSARPGPTVAESEKPGGARVESPDDVSRLPSPRGAPVAPVNEAVPRSADRVEPPVAPPIETVPAEPLPAAPVIRATEAVAGVAPSAPPPGNVALPEPSAAPARVFSAESAALAAIVRDYELAYDRLDAAAAAALWPSVDERALARAFARLQMQNLDFGDCTFAVSQQDATAQCAGLLQYARRIGDTAPKSERHTWTIEFVRAGGSWRITRITAH